MQVGTLGCGAYSTVDHCKLAIQDHFQQADGGKRYSKHNLPIAGASAGCNQATAGRGVVRRSSRRHMGSVPASLGAAVRDVAVKRLRPTLFDSPTELNDFVREAVLLAGLQHRCADQQQCSCRLQCMMSCPCLTCAWPAPASTYGHALREAAAGKLQDDVMIAAKGVGA